MNNRIIIFIRLGNLQFIIGTEALIDYCASISNKTKKMERVQKLTGEDKEAIQNEISKTEQEVTQLKEIYTDYNSNLTKELIKFEKVSSFFILGSSKRFKK